MKLLIYILTLLGATIASASEVGVAYSVALKNEPDKGFEKLVEESTLSFRLKKRLPATFGQLQRRVDKDVVVIEKLLESEGYYDGSVTATVKPDGKEVRVLFLLDAGALYEFGRIQVEFKNNEDARLREVALRLKGNRARATEVFAQESSLLEELRKYGYPFSVLSKRNVVVDRERHRVDITFVFDPQGIARYGEFEVEGLEALSRKYIRRQITWKQGDRYDEQEVRDLEHKLLSSGLFSTARVEVEVPEKDVQRVPMKFILKERDFRTIGLGVGYSDVGPNGKATWEHRNLFGNGERLKLEGYYSEVERRIQASLERPGFLRSNQSIVFDADISRENSEAYDADQVTLGAIVKRDITRHFMLGTGVQYKYSHVDQLGGENYSHFIFPLMGELDYRDDVLNPVSGGQLFGRVSYYEDMMGSDSFFKTMLEGRIYQMLWSRPRLSVAFRAALGSIDGASVQNVPADERFYAGGGGSIRGYEYQMVGPVSGGTPLGGSQSLEFSAELRMQPGPRLGYAAFLDGGTVYDDVYTDYDRSLRYGAGLGVRWFTRLGPLRVDVAYPLNPSAVDVERVQFYISLGQSF